MRAFVFPGQGSQSIGMGKELFREFPEYVACADRILGYSIEELCVSDPDKVLGKTQYTQPALFVVNALSFLGKAQERPTPAYFAGHSLGEYSALFAAGAFDFEDGLRIVNMRGQLMSEASGGGMAAIIGSDVTAIRELLYKHALADIDIANLNSPKQTVISGPLPALEAARPHFEQARAGFIPLPVSAPFHSRYMAPVKEQFGTFLRNFQFRPLNTPVIANVNALPYQDHQIIYNLKEQLCGTVNWTDTINYLVSRGVGDFQEVGPGTVLTRLIKDIRQPVAA
jgi:rhizoxin biosynthesis acyltransferase